MASTRPRVLALYRRLLRLSRSWEATQPSETETERAFIADETRSLFRANKHIKDAKIIDDHIREAEARLTMAEHYRNPYPRPVNMPQGSFSRREGKKSGKAVQKLHKLAKPIYVKSIDHQQ